MPTAMAHFAGRAAELKALDELLGKGAAHGLPGICLQVLPFHCSMSVAFTG
jgi:hypothetical protein